MKIPTSSERMDIAKMRLHLGDDEALMGDLLSLFLGDCPVRLAAIERAVKARRLDAVMTDAHTLRGSAGNLCASGVTRAAAALEEIAERGDVASLDHQFAKLASEVELLVAELVE